MVVGFVGGAASALLNEPSPVFFDLFLPISKDSKPTKAPSKVGSPLSSASKMQIKPLLLLLLLLLLQHPQR
jgi:hypothetical protein